MCKGEVLNSKYFLVHWAARAWAPAIIKSRAREKEKAAFSIKGYGPAPHMYDNAISASWGSLAGNQLNYVDRQINQP